MSGGDTECGEDTGSGGGTQGLVRGHRVWRGHRVAWIQSVAGGIQGVAEIQNGTRGDKVWRKETGCGEERQGVAGGYRVW